MSNPKHEVQRRLNAVTDEIRHLMTEYQVPWGRLVRLADMAVEVGRYDVRMNAISIIERKNPNLCVRCDHQMKPSSLFDEGRETQCPECGYVETTEWKGRVES